MRLLAVLLFSLLALPAWAQINVIPTRVIFEPGQRSAEVTLINTASQAYTFRMGWQDIMYDERGNSMRIEEGAARPTPAASDFIRFSPRLITLGPNESQVIRLMRRGQQEAGEYRSHFLFQRQAAAPTGTATPSDGMSIALNVALGVTIPVVIREGRGEPSVAIRSAGVRQTPDQRWVLDVDLAREGAYSTRTDIELWEGSGNQRRLLARNAGRALYTDTPHYRFEIQLNERPRSGPMTLEVIYQLRDESEQRLSYPLP